MFKETISLQTKSSFSCHAITNLFVADFRSSSTNSVEADFDEQWKD